MEEVGSFLEGYRKAEVRWIARETSTMMLDVLVREGVKGLDRLLAGMAREGDDVDDRGTTMRMSSESGTLNLALVRYLEEAVRSQERRVKRPPVAPRVDDYTGDDVGGGDGADLMWNVTRGEDGTMIETIDPNTPIVERMLREEFERTTRSSDGCAASDALLSTMTVQEKILLLLKLLRDRVKVEAVVGNDAHARNLRVLAYALRAANDEERQNLISDELGHSLDVSEFEKNRCRTKTLRRAFTDGFLLSITCRLYFMPSMYSRILSRPPSTMRRHVRMTISCLVTDDLRQYHRTSTFRNFRRSKLSSKGSKRSKPGRHRVDCEF